MLKELDLLFIFLFLINWPFFSHIYEFVVFGSLSFSPLNDFAVSE